MKQVFKSVTLALAAAASLSSAALAQSAVPDLRVAVGDLDLSRPGDAAIFQTRADAAVSTWCAANLHRFSAQGLGAEAACTRNAQRELKLSIPVAQKEALALAADRAAVVEVAAL